MCACVYQYMCMCARVYVCMCAYVHVYVYVCMCACVPASFLACRQLHDNLIAGIEPGSFSDLTSLQAL